MKKDLLHAIGNTPLAKIFEHNPGSIYAKLEYLNPGGSIKDRSALYMVEWAEHRGLLKPGMTIIDASSGNHGIALAMIGAIKGYNVIICSTEKHSKEKINTIKAYGAQVRTFAPTDSLEDPNSYHSQAVLLQKNTPNSYMPNQYCNPLNAEAHYHGIGKEIWQQTDGKITHLIAAAGTGGTVSGAGKFLKEMNPNIKVIGVDAANSYRSTKGNPKPYKLEGMGVDSESIVLDNSVIDEFIEVTDDQGIDMMKNLAHKHGFLVGPSSGAVAYAAYVYSKNLRPNDIAVILFGDSGRAYLSKGFYE
ncbi:cysteine synthase family protein [Candidatus Dependentiae bacterium]|nr:cysteine synthase family protein [Candidatus Dependentiae bacterium]